MDEGDTTCVASESVVELVSEVLLGEDIELDNELFEAEFDEEVDNEKKLVSRLDFL